MDNDYDVIIVGARCAGAPTAMLLARLGHRVLVVDRARFPSDTVSTHVLQPLAVDALRRWGLFERLRDSGCPPVTTYRYDFGAFTLEGAPGRPDLPPAYCPRRTVLDALLVDAAREAGAEVREGFVVERLLREGARVVGLVGRGDDGAHVALRAAVVVGADGRYSKVAAAVEAETYHARPALQAGYYAYFRDLPLDGVFDIRIRPERGMAAVETHDGLTLVLTGWPAAEFETHKKDIAHHFDATLALAPELADRVRAATRVSRFAGGLTENFFRTPFGPGWALVGDAGYCKDPLTAQGMKDAFFDAERCARALDAFLRGERAFDEAMRTYQRERDAHALPMYELTCQLATLAPPPPELAQLLFGIQASPPAMNAFVQMLAGTIAPPEFFGHPAVTGPEKGSIVQPAV